MPKSHDADRFRALTLDKCNLSLGSGQGKLRSVAVGIGNLGSLIDLILAGALCGVEMGLALAQTPHRTGGVQAALAVLAPTPDAEVRLAS
jgi:alanine-glyoxylate transaminase/serine-glyoxylate transaminase/serine-pyruvate transaminase